MKSDENKIRQLSESLCIAYGGEPGEPAVRDALVKAVVLITYHLRLLHR